MLRFFIKDQRKIEKVFRVLSSISMHVMMFVVCAVVVCCKLTYKQQTQRSCQISSTRGQKDDILIMPYTFYFFLEEKL